ncbi:MAG: hypothetical protein KDI39_18505, partial [Pseudomonadales bacterium]|nr:hypothetical protein [Pseudomonadales bacterium]
MTDYSRSNILLPHFEEAEAFLNALDGKDAQFTFQTFDDVEVWSDEKKKNIKRQNKDLVRVYHGTFNEHKQALAAINKCAGGVFVKINKTDLKGRKKENILKIRAVFVDLDGSPIQPILDLPEDLQPHIIIESSPNKWHAYWLADNCSLELFPHVQRALAAKFKGDIAVNNIDRVMRLSGFSHNKGESFITRIHTMQDDLYPYSMNKLIVGLGLELEQPTQKKQTFDSFSNATHSGDFETVKRAAQGRWTAIFSRLGIALPPDNKHAHCPACGGTDRFRYDNQDGHGTFICNQGGNGILSGDGFALIQHKTGATSSEVLNMVRGIVMPDYQKKPFEPKQAQPRSSTDEEEIETHRNAPRGNDAMLYGIYGEFGRVAAKNTEVNPYAATFNLMIYISSAIGRDVFFYVGNDIHHIRLFGLHIGRSSKGQKGGAHSLLNRVSYHLAEREPTLAPRK